jgi:probable HAF family extracellular repeat protein
MRFLRRLFCVAVVLLCTVVVQSQSGIVESPVLNLTFTSIDIPGAGVVGAYGINNNGDIVGYYGTDSNANKHAFLLRNGVFSYFDYPGKLSTIATGINDAGLITGYTGNFFLQGFLYDGTTFTSVRDGSDTATVVYGINNAGVVVGGAGDPYTTKPFESLGGRFKTLNFPGTYVYGYASGINNFNQVVGYTDYDAYLYSHGTSTKIDIPGAIKTQASGINDNGVIVGSYESCSGSCAFHAYAQLEGKYVSFDYPGATDSFAVAINKAGQIVGQYELSDLTWHGFVSSPITAAAFDHSGADLGSQRIDEIFEPPSEK